MQTHLNNNRPDMFQLVEFLEAFLPTVDAKMPTRINAGGCGIFAKLLHESLQNMGVESKVVFLNYKMEKDKMDYLIENKRFSDRCGTVHCLVAISDYLFLDSTGIKHNPEYDAESKDSDVYVQEMPLDVLDVLINNLDSWNTVFDRDCVPQIKEELDSIPSVFELFKQGKEVIHFKDGVRFTEHTIRELRRGW